jgi:hypothetical protein
LIRLVAYASLTGQEITLPLAQQVLRNIIDRDEKAITIETIQRFVSEYYKLKLSDLKSKNNSKSIAMPQTDRDVPLQAAHARVIARNRTQLWRQTPLHRDSFDSKDRRHAAARSDFDRLIASFLEGFR